MILDIEARPITHAISVMQVIWKTLSSPFSSEMMREIYTTFSLRCSNKFMIYNAKESAKISQTLSLIRYILFFCIFTYYLNRASSSTSSKKGISLIPSTRLPILQTLSNSLALLMKSI